MRVRLQRTLTIILQYKVSTTVTDLVVVIASFVFMLVYTAVFFVLLPFLDE